MILTKAKPKEPTPKEGDRKVTVHFAWWPKKVEEGTIWLERYERHYEYRTRKRYELVMYIGEAPILSGWDIIKYKRINPCA